ncbi:MAG: SpoIID/LytB domain-containing protein [Bacteroidales bacterium]|nr:SpoIID/LytB domain-containing protein [Bacteroidales bacterium]
MKRFFSIILLFFLCVSGFCQTTSIPERLRIRIYAENSVSSASVLASFGSYTLNGREIKRQDKINISISENKVQIAINEEVFGTFDTVRLCSEDLKCFFQITPQGLKSRRYDNNLEITLAKDKKSLQFINIVTPDNYIAGVVQSEAGGASDNVEFFKVQAICCRNYMMRNINKHQHDGYNLCDCVNCQVYFSRANKEQVIEGAAKSNGEVIVDADGNIIETLFHSNSGGQTMNAKDVWKNDIDYLKSVTDSFSIGQPNYTWEKEISEKEWLSYFKGKGIDVKDYNNKQELLNFSQDEGRKVKIFDIPLTQIRKDFKLKSTFFSVTPWGSNVKLKGKGYGHGVGMSQEGAAKMCEEGYEYWQVIEHYYTGIKIKNLKTEK